MKNAIAHFLIGIATFLSWNIIASAATINKISIIGNQKVSNETIFFYMKSREKNVYSTPMLKDDFKALWKTGFFENITIEAFDNPSSDDKWVRITVEENPTISTIDYKIGTKIKRKDIEEALQKSNIILTNYSYFNSAKIKKTERVIREMLVEKGYAKSSVAILVDSSQGSQVALTLKVSPGNKTRIGEIVFTGIENSNVSTTFLLNGMKENKPHSLLSVINSKDVYNKEKIKDDLESLKLRLQQKGYLEAKVGTPTLSTFRKRLATGKKQYMQRIEIPVQLGPQYRLGKVTVTGNKFIKKGFLEKMVKMKEGEIYNVKKRDKIREDIQELYGNLGHIFAQIIPAENLDPEKMIADLTLQIVEGEVAYVGKLEFSGNTYTRDNVIRREWYLREGDRFNSNWLKNCLTRLKQQGLVDMAKEPEFKPHPEDPKTIDVKVNVKEMNRQNVTFYVGYSGYNGYYANLGYSTQNFMGLGETLGVSALLGTKSNQYSLSFTESYFLGMPFNLGFSVNKSSVEYDWYSYDSEGFSLNASGRILGFIGGSLQYSYQKIDISDLIDAIASDPVYSLYYQDRNLSSISPTLYYSTVDSSIFPTRGAKILFNYRLTGGPLGGDVDMHKFKVQLAKFFPVTRRFTLGIQAIHQTIIGFGENDIPYYERIYLGGEQSIRGYEFYDIGPRSALGYNYGGNKAFYVNLEYMYSLSQAITLSTFCDFGNAYDFGEPISLKNMYSSTGLEVRVFVPILNVPFRLIFAYNSRLLETTDAHFAFRFALGTSFN